MTVEILREGTDWDNDDLWLGDKVFYIQATDIQNALFTGNEHSLIQEVTIQNEKLDGKWIDLLALEEKNEVIEEDVIWKKTAFPNRAERFWLLTTTPPRTTMRLPPAKNTLFHILPPM